MIQNRFTAFFALVMFTLNMYLLMNSNHTHACVSNNNNNHNNNNNSNNNDKVTSGRNLKEVEARVTELEWQLHMRMSRNFPGISYPLENGLASKCIPQPLLHQIGTRDFAVHSKADPALPPEHSASQVSQFVFDHMELKGSPERVPAPGPGPSGP
jgi:hypothetical protein